MVFPLRYAAAATAASTAAASIWIPGPIVELSVILLMNLPFAAAGLALRIAESSAWALAARLSASKLILPMGECTMPALSTRNSTLPALISFTARATSKVKEIKAGKVEFRVDKAGIVHSPIGKISFDADNLAANAQALLSAILKAKPAAAKGKFIKRITLSSTMGPGIQIDAAAVEAAVAAAA